MARMVLVDVATVKGLQRRAAILVAATLVFAAVAPVVIARAVRSRPDIPVRAGWGWGASDLQITFRDSVSADRRDAVIAECSSIPVRSTNPIVWRPPVPCSPFTP